MYLTSIHGLPWSGEIPFSNQLSKDTWCFPWLLLQGYGGPGILGRTLLPQCSSTASSHHRVFAVICPFPSSSRERSQAERACPSPRESRVSPISLDALRTPWSVAAVGQHFPATQARRGRWSRAGFASASRSLGKPPARGQDSSSRQRSLDLGAASTPGQDEMRPPVS